MGKIMKKIATIAFPSWVKCQVGKYKGGGGRKRQGEPPKGNSLAILTRGNYFKIAHGTVQGAHFGYSVGLISCKNGSLTHSLSPLHFPGCGVTAGQLANHHLIGF